LSSERISDGAFDEAGSTSSERNQMNGIQGRPRMAGSQEALDRFERQTAWPMMALASAIIPLLASPSC
jgi:hypothetical protein